ncbi:MAG TPA: hypothetical protein VFW66_07860 [Gemmatimonadales bacterium]|nr:hypothetical protein [Gemmatimonadales bacterium]
MGQRLDTGAVLTFVALAAAIALGCALRSYLVLSRDFPLNDGGLFYTMARDLQRNGYLIPPTTSYNGGALPFAYPPVGIYAAALVSGAGLMSLLDALRFLPLGATCLTLVPFALLARELLPSRTAQVGATFAFAVVPRSFDWLLMGGGLTRAFGFLFALSAIWLMARLFRTGDRRCLAAAAVAAALSVASHVGTAPFLVLSIVLVFLAYGRSAAGVRWMLLLGLGTAVLSAPWWATVLAQHGLAPFRAASATGASIFSGGPARYHIRVTLAALGIGTTGEAMAPIVWMLAVVGVVATLVRRAFLLPIWWLFILVLDARQGLTFATVPVALLAGLAVADVLVPLTTGRLPATRTRGAGLESPAPARGGARGWGALVTAAVLAGLIAYSAHWATNREPSFGGDGWSLEALAPAERSAMAWARTATPAGSRFLVVTSAGWSEDRAGEWFPSLAERRSIATVQGTEWMPHREFARMVTLHEKLQSCAERTERCLDQWFATSGLGAEYLFVPKAPRWPCCRTLVQDLAASPQWERVFDGPGATIFRRRGAPAD